MNASEVRMTDAQELTLRRLCQGYGCEFRPADYMVYPADSSMMPGWVEGWVGGYHGADAEHSPRTIYVGVSPQGEASS